LAQARVGQLLGRLGLAEPSGLTPAAPIRPA